MKRLVSIFVVALLATVSAFGQTFDLQLSQSEFPVNRKDKILWTDMSVSNSTEVKDLKFKIKRTYIGTTNFGAKPIPGRPVLLNGKTDDTKWTSADNSSEICQFHYWMDPNNSQHYLASGSMRKIMELFLTSDNAIPDVGQVELELYDFVVKGPNDQDLSMPGGMLAARRITINLGTLPPSELNLRLANVQVTRTESINKVDLDLEGSGKAFKTLSFDLALPNNWSKPELSNPNIGTVTANGSKWQIALNNNFTASTSSYQRLIGLALNFPSNSSGQVELILNNFIAKDSSGKVLTSVNELRSSVDLKQPFTVKETVKFVTDPQSQPIFSLDNYKQSGAGDMIAGLMIDNTDKVVKTVSFSIEMPDYFRIESVISAFDGGFATVQQTGLINGYRKYDVQLTAKTAWPANLSTDNPKTFLVDNFKFTDLDYGDLKLKLSNISAKDGSGAVVNATKSLDWTISTKPIFSRFKKGDSDYNFGNGKVDLQDLQRLADYLAGKLPNRSLYQFWAFDYNGDGLVNQKDLTDMSRDLGVSGVDEEELAKLNFNITSFGELKFNHDSDLVKDLELSVYTPTGSLVYQGKLNDQSRLPESIANGPYYWRLSSQFGNVLIIR